MSVLGLSPSKLAVLAPCMNAQGGNDEDGEWPNNLLSSLTIVDESGAIFRRGHAIERVVSSEEMILCARIAREAKAIMRDSPVGMGSESSSTFAEFFVAATAGIAPAARIDEPLVRRAFGETIFPPATISVEPLKEAGVWWSEVLADGEGQGDAYLAPWRDLMKSFASHKSIVDSAFVRIGDYRALVALKPSGYPDGTDSPGCVLPRLALGLTRAGSIAGVFGYVVQT